MTVVDQTWSPSFAIDDPPAIDERQVGDLGAMIIAALGRSSFVTFDPTGFEYGRPLLQRFYVCAGFARTAYTMQPPAMVEHQPDAEPAELVDVVSAQPFVAVRRPEPPAVADNLVDEVSVLTGLTRREVADVLGVSERYLLQLRHDPEAIGHQREDRLNALRTISGALIGGLGRRRTAEWLRHGDPSPLDLIQAGRTDEVLEIARRVRA